MCINTHSNYSCSSCGKVSKNFLIILIGIVITLIVLGFVMPWIGRITIKEARYWRSVKLQTWHKKVASFIKEKKHPPKSLSEICRDEIELGHADPSFVVSLGESLTEKQAQSFKSDPNRFEELVEYGLFSGKRGWFVRELKPGKIYTKMLMIDQDGNIYQIREVLENK